MIRLRVLGTLDLRGPAGQEVRDVLAQPKRCALLCYLALAQPLGYHQRDTLLALFWPECDQAHARHALRQALHYLRRALGPGVFAARGDEEIGLVEGALWCDAVAFPQAVAELRLVDALELYRGDLLAGFFIPSPAAEFERWLEDERARLCALAARAAWSLAETEEQARNPAGAAQWARRAASLAPDDEAALRRLVSLLDRLGDRKGALRAHAEFQRRLADEFQVRPAAETRALIEAVRSREEPTALPSDLPVTRVPVARTHEPLPLSAAPPRAVWRRRNIRLSAVVAASVLMVVGLARSLRGPVGASPMVAVGAFDDPSGADTSIVARSFAQLLATDLARIAGLPVVSRPRLYEVLGELGGKHPTPSALAMAARRAGARELLEGVVYPRAGDTIRVDVRRVDLEKGVVLKAYAVEGRDIFALADSVTARVATGLELPAPRGPIAGVATTSLVARRFYEEGLRTLYLQSPRAAATFFHAALGEDSTFAMAAYYAGMSELNYGAWPEGMADYQRAARLADRAPDLDRLIIKQMWTALMNDAAQLALAETLVVRYPAEPDGELALGSALAWAGDPLGSIPHLRRAVVMDSLSLRGQALRCRACDAFAGIVAAYETADSLDAAERTAREWVRLQPASYQAWGALAGVLACETRLDAALDALKQAVNRSPGTFDYLEDMGEIAIAVDDFALADRVLTTRINAGAGQGQIDALWTLVISLRNQGRLRQAWQGALRLRRLVGVDSLGVAALLQAQVLFESGRYAQAAALFDSLAVAAGRDPRVGPSAIARNRGWALTHVATALAAAGDTTRLPRLADSVEVLGRRSGFGRDRPLHFHTRGLLLEARGQGADAATAFRHAVSSISRGYTRTNYELGRLLSAEHRPTEAIAILQPALRGWIEASNLYITRTELHDVLAQAFEAAGQRDSAAVHYRRVAAAWSHGDPEFRSRAKQATARVAALTRPL